MITAIV